jgi:acetylornithine deacetylase
MDVQKKINDYVEKNREFLVELIQKLVRIESLEGNEGNVQREIQNVLAQIDDDLILDVWEPDINELKKHPAFVPVEKSYEGRPNVVAVRKGSGEGRSLILNGHVDVVPTGESGTWKFNDPWSGRLENGRIYGRGSCDMKAGVSINIFMLKLLKELGISLKGDLIVESVIDEETGGNGTLDCVLRGYKADGLIYTEPFGLDTVSIANRGAQYFRIKVKGQEGGTEYTHDLINPIDKAMEIISAVKAYSIYREVASSHPLYDNRFNTKVPLAITKINAGEWPSTIASECCMEGTIECLPNEDIHKVKKDFAEYLMKWCEKDPWLSVNPVELTWFGLWFEGADQKSDTPFIQSFVESAGRTRGKEIAVIGAGGCDLRISILYGNTPSIVYGPGGGLLHSTDEYVEVEQVIECAKVIANFIIDWCGVAGC